MIKESRNLTSVAKLFARNGHNTAHLTKLIGKKNVARFKAMFDRNLAAAQAGQPYDQRFMDIMYPRVEQMFVTNQLPARDFRRFYSKSKLFDAAKHTILHRNALHRNSGINFSPKEFSRAEQREGLQYLRGLRNHTDLSKKVSNKLDDLNKAKQNSQWYSLLYNPDAPMHRYIEAGPDITSFAKSQGFLSREALLRQAKKEKINLNKKDLREPFYINKGTALASSQTVPKSPWLRDVTSAIDNELEYTAANIAEAKQTLQQAPRSIQRAAAIVDGQNILQPGTRANRFFTKLQQSNSPGIKRLLASDRLNEMDLLESSIRGDNAFYNTDGNFIAVNPKTPFRFRNRPIYEPASLEAHERGHFFAHNLPEAEHRAIAKTLFTKLKRAAAKYNLNIPFDNPASMQEAFAEGYAALKLGKLRPFDTRLNGAFHKAKLDKINPRTYRSDIRNLKKINNVTDLDDVTKQMLNQLQVSYDADIFKHWQ